MPELTDACGRVVAVPERPQRVVCLCPSLTETLFELGLDERLVGRTRYCIHPAPQIDAVAVVGGTKKIDFDAMTACAPDLVIAEKEENRREDVEALAQRWPVYVCDIQNLEQALDAIGVLGRLTGQDMTAAHEDYHISSKPNASLPIGNRHHDDTVAVAHGTQRPSRRRESPGSACAP